MYLLFQNNTKFDDNLAECQAAIAKIDAALGYPNAQGTSTYARPIILPDGIGVAVEILSDDVKKLLDVGDQDKVIETLPENLKNIEGEKKYYNQ